MPAQPQAPPAVGRQKLHLFRAGGSEVCSPEPSTAISVCNAGCIRCAHRHLQAGDPSPSIRLFARDVVVDRGAPRHRMTVLGVHRPQGNGFASAVPGEDAVASVACRRNEPGSQRRVANLTVASTGCRTVSLGQLPGEAYPVLGHRAGGERLRDRRVTSVVTTAADGSRPHPWRISTS